MPREAPEWWPPKVGDKLRHQTLHGDGQTGGVKHVDALLHVLSVFPDQDGETRIVTAEWYPTKRRWNYEVWWWYQAAIGTIFRDGTEKPT
jgi:hypothetical protein